MKSGEVGSSFHFFYYLCTDIRGAERIQNSEFRIQNSKLFLHFAFLLAEIIPIEPKQVMLERDECNYIPLFKLIV
jgi:hypothetical protein